MASKRILLSVGDDSGDLHAAHLMRAMREAGPDLQFCGFGMERMVAAGMKPLQAGADAESHMWLRNVLRFGRYRQRLHACCRAIDSGAVDLVVAVDFGGFNLCLCQRAAARGVPVFYYIPPQVWAHGRYRLKKLCKWTTRCGLIYPFEVDLYRRWQVQADYVGSPLFDEVAANPPDQSVVTWLQQQFGSFLVGIFPGSRRQEIRAHVPIITGACRRIREQVPDVVLAMVTTAKMRPVLEELLRGDEPIELLEQVRPVELARAATLCITKSGTITLEVASQRTPMVIFYRTSPIMRFVAQGLGETEWFGLINVLAGKQICPERLMACDDDEWLAGAALRFLRDPNARESCRRAIDVALEGYDQPGAARRAARAALDLL